MWKDNVERRYHWAKIRSQLDELLFELSKAEEEEEVGLYLLRLHLDNKIDLKFFTAAQRERVSALFSILINDTKRHQELLAGAIRELGQKRQIHAG